MVLSIQAKIDARRLKKLMEQIPKELTPELARALDRHGYTFTSYLRRTRFQGGPSSLKSRTGALARSAGHRLLARNTLKSMRLVVFIGGGRAKKYARIQEFGGTIKGNPWLTVPLPDNRTAAGVPRFKSARRLKETRPGKTFIVKTKRGNLLIAYKPYKNRDKILWLWVLRREVRLRPRLGFIKTWNSRRMKLDRVAALRIAMRRAIEKSRAKNGGRR